MSGDGKTHILAWFTNSWAVNGKFGEFVEGVFLRFCSPTEHLLLRLIWCSYRKSTPKREIFFGKIYYSDFFLSKMNR